MMENYRRKSVRLKEYDYSQPGDYFVSNCTMDHDSMFGTIMNGEMHLNKKGDIFRECWETIPGKFKNVELDLFIIMPNHVHGIIAICEYENNGKGEVTSPRQKPTLEKIIAFFKYQSTKMINELQGTPAAHVWQRNYFDLIIRGEKELQNIHDDIANNVLAWVIEAEHPENIPL